MYWNGNSKQGRVCFLSSPRLIKMGYAACYVIFYPLVRVTLDDVLVLCVLYAYVLRCGEVDQTIGYMIPDQLHSE